MCRRIVALLSVWALLGAGLAEAQPVADAPSRFKLYGFVRNYIAFDTREVSAGTQDLYFYMPRNISMEGGVDRAATPSLRMLSLTTRLGLSFSGYRIGDLQVGGAVEGDFYCMTGSAAVLRMRQAYVGLLWDNLELGDLLVNVGQTWHPVAADMPHVTNLETGAPFNPFNRSPQVMFHWMVRRFTLTGGILYPMQYLPVAPTSTTEPLWNPFTNQYVPSTTLGAAKSADPVKYGMIPEVYLGLSYQGGGFLGRAGVNFFSSMPRWQAPSIKIVDEATKELSFDYENTSMLKARLFAFSPFVFLQYTNGSFQVRAKGILAQSGEHLNLLSGYAATYNWKRHALEYTPMQDLAAFLSFQYGKKFQVMGMFGYMQQIGTTRTVFAYWANDVLNNVWLNTAADSRIQRAFRATPTIAYNLGRLTFSLEYNLTGAWFGTGTRNRGGLYGSGHWVLNHRVLQMVKFNF